MTRKMPSGDRLSNSKSGVESKNAEATKDQRLQEKKPMDTFISAKDSDVTLPRVAKVSVASKKEKRGMATVENTLNSMTGDISYEDLLKVPGISLMAIKAKESVGEVSIFQRKDYVSSLKAAKMSDISYHNIPLISQFVATSARIVPSRISAVEAKSQKLIARSIKIARFLGLLKYVDY